MPDPLETDDDAIAVIGMAARVPGAVDIEQFWENLVTGRESVQLLDEHTLLASGVQPEQLADRNYVRAAAPVADADCFDAGLFGFTPRDAAATDPQIRLFLEIAHAAIENAGYDPAAPGQTIGVIASAGPSRYAVLHLGENAAQAGGAGLGLHALNHSDYVATTTSYRLNLHGPSLTVLTACSSSLVAVHLACQSLRAGDCDAVLVGAADVEFPIGHGYLWSPGSILSRDGHCRPFDAAAAGTVFGSGAAAVLLKPLAEARQDGDRVSAVILGSAVNNDGAGKVSFGAPSIAGQASVVMEAMQLAGVGPAEIGYVEMHGTGTPLGDPMEVAALTEAYAALAAGPLAPGSCGIGSVKGNVGHLGPVAGIIGLVKTALALEREQLPPTINLTTVNPQLNLGAGPFEPVREVRSWPASPIRPRSAAVSSLGIGGTNAHVVMTEAPGGDRPYTAPRPQLVVWSGRDKSACQAAGQRLADWFVRTGNLEFADGVATLQHGRAAYAVRRAVVAADARDAASAVLDPARTIGPETAAVTVVPGQLSGPEAAFRRLAERVPLVATTLAEVLAGCGAPGQAAAGEWADGRPFGQLLVLATRLALARVWLKLGVQASELRAPDDVPALLAVLDGTASPAEAAASVRLATPGAAGDPDALWRAHLGVLGRVWVSGGEPSWATAGCLPPQRRAALPGYPYQRSRHWVPATATARPETAGRDGHATAAGARWFPVWRDVSAAVSRHAAGGRTPPALSRTALLVAPAGSGASRGALPALHQLGFDVVRYRPASEFTHTGDRFAGRLTPADLGQALARLDAAGRAPALVVNALAFGDAAEPAGFAGSPRAGPDDSPAELILTSHAADVSGSDPVRAAHAALAGEALAHRPGGHWIDASPSAAPDRLATAIAAALGEDVPDRAFAVRGTRVWSPAGESLPLPAAGRGLPLGRRAASVLIVDADGEVALALGGAIAAAGSAGLLQVITAAGDAPAKALAALKDSGPVVDLVPWAGDSTSLPSAVSRAAGNARLAAVFVVGGPARAVAALAAATRAGLCGVVPDVAVTVCTAAGYTASPAVAAACGAAATAAPLGAERAVTVLTGSGQPFGATLLALLTTPVPDVIVSAR